MRKLLSLSQLAIDPPRQGDKRSRKQEETGTSYRNDNITDAIYDYRFTALTGGVYSAVLTVCQDIKQSGIGWSSTECDSGTAWIRRIDSESPKNRPFGRKYRLWI